MIETTLISPTNEVAIPTWKKKTDHIILIAIWKYKGNTIFSHIRACKIAYEAWLALKNTDFA